MNSTWATMSSVFFTIRLIPIDVCRILLTSFLSSCLSGTIQWHSFLNLHKICLRVHNSSDSVRFSFVGFNSNLLVQAYSLLTRSLVANSAAWLMSSNQARQNKTAATKLLRNVASLTQTLFSEKWLFNYRGFKQPGAERLRVLTLSNSAMEAR